MTNWLNQIQNFWRDANKAPALAPVHEPLKRNERFASAYALWQSGAVLERLRIRYQREIIGERGQGFTRIDGPAAAGFWWEAHHPQDQQEFDFLAEHFKDKLLALDYKLYQADRRLYNRTDQVEELHRWYLKPRLKPADFKAQALDQLWGNIQITVKRSDGNVQGMLFQLNKYNDRMYREARSFDSLMELLLI